MKGDGCGMVVLDAIGIDHMQAVRNPDHEYTKCWTKLVAFVFQRPLNKAASAEQMPWMKKATSDDNITKDWLRNLASSSQAKICWGESGLWSLNLSRRSIMNFSNASHCLVTRRESYCKDLNIMLTMSVKRRADRREIHQAIEGLYWGFFSWRYSMILTRFSANHCRTLPIDSHRVVVNFGHLVRISLKRLFWCRRYPIKAVRVEY